MNSLVTSKEILKKVFGYDQFRGEQEKVINAVLRGENTLCLMPTGMGKSLCYQIPAILSPGLTVVISPLIALMNDQVTRAKSVGMNCHTIHSGQDKKEREKTYELLKKKKIQLLYVTPERFQNSLFIEALKQNTVPLLAVDEAHCISEWGHDFRPDYTRIPEFQKLLGSPTTLALTATATEEVQRDLVKLLQLKNNFKGGIERPNLSFLVEDLHGFESKFEKLTQDMSDYKGSRIIYCALISTLEKVSMALHSRKIPHQIYHGQLPAKTRKHSQKLFMENENEVMVATPAFGLGIDKNNIRNVTHFEIPGAIESYYQEAGRAGRDGKPSRCVLFYDSDDITIQMDFIKWANPDPEFLSTVYSLIQNNPDRVNAEGTDFLRGQMHFYHSRDFRIETALNLFERWDCTSGSLFHHNLKALEKPHGEWMDPALCKKRLEGQHCKLLQLVEYAKSTDCRSTTIYKYFGAKNPTPCGHCDTCLDP